MKSFHTLIARLAKPLLTILGTAGLASLAFAADAPAAPPVPNKGDTAFMMLSTVLVLSMIVPGLALFYGGLVRSKNMLSVLMQVMVGAALILCSGPSMATHWLSRAAARLLAALTKRF